MNRALWKLLSFLGVGRIPPELNDHLEPVALSMVRSIFKSEEAKAPILDHEMNDSLQLIARYLVEPSFEPTYSFFLSEFKGHYFLHFSSRSYMDPTVENAIRFGDGKYDRKISRELGDAIRKMFLTFLRDVKAPVGGNSGFDGEVYYFSIMHPNIGWITGRKWSPYEGTVMKRLIRTCDLIHTSIEDRKIAESNILTAIESLMEAHENRPKPKRPPKDPFLYLITYEDDA